ncbi:MAG: MBOAT family protein [Clostridia bacterium]|nr:MBOAT family protein [Clostridia bacterium]
MAFVSFAFILFLVVLVPVYYLVPKKAQFIVLLAGSVFFYAFCGWRSLLYIIAATLNSYLFARWLSSAAKKENGRVEQMRETWSRDERKAFRVTSKKKRFRILVLGLVIGFGLLCIPKYTAFTVSNINAITGASITIPSLLLPMGISFYTFQSMGYLIDVYREKTECERNFAKYALFVTYFPQLLQGPISRFSDLSPQLLAPHDPEWDRMMSGFLRILWGYFKKVVVADTALLAVGTILSDPETYNGIYVFFLLLLYAAQIYGDFTGGIDITLGISEMLGIYVKENFDHPFSSLSTKEYWRRWHITMGTWFTDYVFYPLSVCRPMQRFSKWSREHLGNAVGRRLPVYFATIVTWFLTGLWHGASWNFIVWGLLNCLVILISQELNPLYEKFHKRFPNLAQNTFYRHFAMIRTFLLMGFIRTLDCYRDVPLTFSQWGTMFYAPGFSRLFTEQSLLGLNGWQWLLLGLSLILVWQVSRNSPNDAPLRHRIAARPVAGIVVAACLIFVVLIFGSWGIGFDASQFIYNQF